MILYRIRQFPIRYANLIFNQYIFFIFAFEKTSLLSSVFSFKWFICQIFYLSDILHRTDVISILLPKGMKFETRSKNLWFWMWYRCYVLQPRPKFQKGKNGNMKCRSRNSYVGKQTIQHSHHLDNPRYLIINVTCDLAYLFVFDYFCQREGCGAQKPITKIKYGYKLPISTFPHQTNSICLFL